jgi:hypothetical protein
MSTFEWLVLAYLAGLFAQGQEARGAPAWAIGLAWGIAVMNGVFAIVTLLPS